MTNQPATTRSRLPHHKLIAHMVARELLEAIKAANIRDATLKEHALKSAKSVCLTTAEGAGRVMRRDKAYKFAIARGETTEAVAAVEIAAIAGEADAAVAERCVEIGDRLVALLTGLTR